MEQVSKKNRVMIGICRAPEEEIRREQDIRLVYCLDGQLSVVIEERTSILHAEDVLVINADKSSRMLPSDAEVLYAVFTISFQLVSDVLHSLDILYWCDSSGEDDERYDELRDVLKKLLRHYIRTSGEIGNFKYIMLCYQLMDVLSLHFLVQRGSFDEQADAGRYEERIRQISAYIHTNYAQPISMKELSEQLYLSNGYLSRFFKKNYGMSFADYLTKVRLYHAADDLLYTRQPITRIAYDNGFANEAVFNKAFKAAYQMTPSVFRRKALQEKQKEKETPYSREIEEKLVQFLSPTEKPEERKNSDRETTQVRAQAPQKLAPVWKMINIGSARELLRYEVREHLLILKEECGIEYVRFWNLFSESMLLHVEGTQRNYNFSRLDSILDFLTENQLKPHIELCPKPKRILSDAQTDLLMVEEEAFAPPDADWMYFLEKLMGHIVRRYGRAETDTWHMELWWDERNPRDEAHAARYMEMFANSRQIIKQYSPLLKLGGFGVRFYHPQEEKLLRTWLHREDGPDFVSLTIFAYDRIEDGGVVYNKRNSDADALTRKVNLANRILKEENASAVGLYITEWNLTISDRNYMNDTCFKGAYCMRHFLAFYGKVKMAAYYTATDRTAELSDSGDPLFGGMGLLTKIGVMKPSGFACKFLEHLFPYFAGKGENYILTADGHGNYALAAQNMRRLNPNYFFSPEDRLEKENLWKYSEDRNTLQLEIAIDGAVPGTYRVKTYRVNEESGSVMGIWRELGFADQLDREDIRYFRKVNEPKMTMQLLKTDGESLRLKQEMKPDEILYMVMLRC